jgi:hypothetical protein
MASVQPDYWAMTNKELVTICKEHRIHRWSGKRKKDLIAMIRAATATVPVLNAPPPTPVPTPLPTPLPTRPASPLSQEPYEFLDELLVEHANRARAFLPKSPTDEEETHTYEWSAVQTTPATEGPIIRFPVGIAAISAADIAINLESE